MQVGVVFPQTEIGADAAGVKAYAQAVQQIGYQHLMVYDHVVGADTSVRPDWSGPYTAESMFHEPMVLFGYLAGVAPRLELVTGVIILPQRQTVLAAKQAAEVDVLTGGKLRFGVGIGWNEVEYEALGSEFHNRGRRFEEQVAVMRRLWTEPVITFEGKYHCVRAAGINPLPVQRPIPVWFGASADSAIRRATHLADGYFPQRPMDGSWDATFEKIDRWLAEAGRSRDSFGIDARINTAKRSPDQWKREADEWRGRGATHLTINTMNDGLRGPDAHVDKLREAYQAITS